MSNVEGELGLEIADETARGIKHYPKILLAP